MNRDDENWFDALAGKPNPDTDSLTLQEATALRAALLASKEHQQCTTGNVVSIEALQKLKERLRVEGLLDKKPRVLLSHTTIAASLAASIIIGVSLSFSLLNTSQAPYSESTVIYRGASDVAAIMVDSPELTANQISQQLSGLNIKAQVQCGNKTCVVEAYIPSEREIEVNALLKKWEKTVNMNGQLRLIFQTQGQ